MCCFVLLIPTPEEYRVPRVNPGVTASKLFPPLLPSLATPGPPLPYRPLQNIPVLLSEVQSGVQHLLGLISGLRRGGRGIPISSLVVEMDLLLSRRLRLSNSCPSSPVPARWPALGRGGVHLCLWYVRGVCAVNRCGGGWGGSVTPGGGPMGDCLRPIHIWALPRSCSYGPGGGGEVGAS